MSPFSFSSLIGLRRKKMLQIESKFFKLRILIISITTEAN